jgi:general secretion pathway protein B
VSFILDAIAKSEHDRQQQEVPGAHSLALPVGSVRRPRRVLSYLVGMALILNAILLVIWMQSDRPLLEWFSLSGNDAIEQATEQASVSDNSSTTNTLTTVDISATAASSSSTMEIDNTVSASDSPAEPGGKAFSDSRDTNADLEGESEITQHQDVAEAVSAGDTAWVRIEPGTLSSKTSPGVEPGNQAAGGQDDGEVTFRKVSRLSELPADVRRDLPSVNFTGHLYSSNPRSSYVFVNGGRPVTAGRQIADELYLHEITPTGVVVKFRGYLIDVGVLQNWNLR